MFHTPRVLRAALGLAVATAAVAGAVAPSASAAVAKRDAKLPTSMHLEIQPKNLEVYFGWSGATRPDGTFSFFVDGKKVGTATVPAKPPVGKDLHGYKVIANSPWTIPNGKPHTVLAQYNGDATYAPVSQTIVRTDPKISAWVHSKTKMTKYGWYRTPVTIGFTCTAGSGNIACPKPAYFAKSNPRQYAIGIMIASDGGRAQVTQYVSIDRVKPTVSMKLVKGRATCHGSDAMSGLAHCTLTRSTKNGKKYYTVTAVDKAGNARSVTGRL